MGNGQWASNTRFLKHERKKTFIAASHLPLMQKLSVPANLLLRKRRELNGGSCDENALYRSSGTLAHKPDSLETPQTYHALPTNFATIPFLQGSWYYMFPTGDSTLVLSLLFSRQISHTDPFQWFPARPPRQLPFLGATILALPMMLSQPRSLKALPELSLPGASSPRRVPLSLYRTVF